MDVDEKLLAFMAKETGGKFFRATDTQGLVDTFATIDALEKSEIKTTKYTRFREVFQDAALPSVACLLLSGLLFAFVFQVTPR